MAFSFDGIENAEIFERGSYLPPGGTFWLKVNKILTKDTQQSGPAFIVEFTVLKSTHPDVRAGVRKTFFQKLTDKNVAFPAILEFMAALLGVDKAEKEEFESFKGNIKKILNQATNFEGSDEDHPLHGETVKVTTWSKETKKGNDFTVHDWEIWSEEDGFEDVA